MTISSGLPRLSRRSFLAASAGVAGTLYAPAIKAQGAVTLRLMNTETAIASIEALKKIVADYKAQTGVTVLFDNVPPAEEYSKLSSANRKKGGIYETGVFFKRLPRAGRSVRPGAGIH